MLTPGEAWERLAPHLAPLLPETLPRRAAAGRVLAAPLAAAVDVPPADVSAMDGYAVAAPVAAGDELPVAGTVAAGDPPGAALAAGTALRIMTGAPLPAGADRVVPVELTDAGAERVRLEAVTDPGAHIRRRGEILGRGAEVLAPGALLGPGALSLLATHGFAEVAVRRAPRVTLIVTGDEVVPPEVTPGPGQLRDSHSDFLSAAVGQLGLELTHLGIAGDRVEALAPRIAEGLAADVLLLTGGVSMGEYDLVEGVLAEAGCRALFTAVRMQPGKPLVAALRPAAEGRDACLVLGLPGNPASVMVAYWLFVRPALRRLLGLVDATWHGALAGELAGPLPGAKDRDRFLPAEVAFAGARILVTPVDPKGSHDLAAYARGSALVRVPAGAEPAPSGHACEVLPLGEWQTVTRESL